LVSDKTRRQIGLGVLVLLGLCFVAGVTGIVVADIEKVSTDPIERVLTPVLTGLIGVLGGLFASTSRTD
jgi:TctA family transporter